MKISLFNRHVTVLDYAYLDDHKGIVGDSLWVNVTFVGETDGEGVVYDFSLAKKKVKEIVDREVDHRLVIPTGLAERESGNLQFTYKYGFEEDFIDYKCPEEGVCELPNHYVSEENLRTHLEQIIMAEMPKNISNVQIELESESFKDVAKYHYTHGLKDHYGNCQRLYHGHKNTIEVEINGKRSLEYEEYLADDLLKRNIHFCFFENVVNKAEIQKLTGQEAPLGVFTAVPRVHITYKSSQGDFTGSLPGKEIYFMQTESTVENISIHLAQVIKQKVGAGKTVAVRAFEGIGKGALTTI